MQPHTLYSEVLAVASEVKNSGADSIITLGGGSLIDGAKGIVFAIANEADTMQKMDRLFKESNEHRHALKDGTKPEHELKPSTISIMCVTTTLSAGEVRVLVSFPLSPIWKQVVLILMLWKSIIR
jgi:alcohol dehydrogenase class IV